MQQPVTIPKTKWQIAPPVPDAVQRQFEHVPEVLLQVLYNRGLVNPADVQAFLEGRYLANTDPFALTDMDKAVARIKQAIEQDEGIVVYGDFDADGVTSTVLLTEALRGLGVERRQIRPYIPDRVDEGYGLNLEALTKIREEYQASLVITVDCGIRSVAEIKHANAIGLDVILTDHHGLGPELPPATAVINPKRPSSAYPEKMLAGVGIAYKLAEALCQAMPERVQFDLDSLLDLVAIGTVADLAPLLGENRQLVIRGLEVINKAQRPGLAALSQVVRLKPGNITAENIGFGLGPRINAAGRLDHAYTAAKLLATNNSINAETWAVELDALNRRRQQLTSELGELAESLVEDPEGYILIAGHEQFLSGIVGLVASRIAEKHYRPTIILEYGAEESRASCRSIPEFHITDALDKVADLLVRHGGHAQAAGFTIRNKHLPEFKARMLEIATRELDGKTLVPTITIDKEIPLEQLDWSLQDLLTQLEPTGYANATPIFVSRHVEVASHRVVGREGTHLQMKLTSPDNGTFEFGRAPRILSAIAFRQAMWAAQMPRYIDVVYTIGVNEWNGRRDLQLVVQDIRPSENLSANS